MKPRVQTPVPTKKRFAQLVGRWKQENQEFKARPGKVNKILFLNQIQIKGQGF
jgi:hypothetical protein